MVGVALFFSFSSSQYVELTSKKNSSVFSPASELAMPD
jgi:hypothetical protein